MESFAGLLEALACMPSRNGKIRLLTDYFARAPDPDRGWGLAALTGGLRFPNAKPGMVRALVAERVDASLFAWSYDYLGDFAETVSLIWPDFPGAGRVPALSEVVTALAGASREEAPRLIEGWLDVLDATGRFALLKLLTGALRVDVPAWLARSALAEYGGRPVEAIEEVWHGLAPPYEGLFAWLEGRAPRPVVAAAAAFRPLMLANSLEEADLAGLDPAAYRAEWKWDGIRVQLVARGGQRRIYARSGDEITAAFPEISEAMAFDAVLDGELLVARDGVAAPLDQLRQRLARKRATARLLAECPAWVRLYDLLQEGAEDLRGLPFDGRRARLEAWAERVRPARMDLSPLLPFAGWDALAALRRGAREAAIEGLMLKRGDSPYLAGRPQGPWFKWKRGPLTLDTVLMYARRGQGERSSFYADVTFGAWRKGPGGGELVPVGKACSGITDDELGELDRWVRAHTVERYGPVRAVEPKLVLEVAFDSVHRSPRHKSGVAMRFPRIRRIRWDKPAEEADRVEALERLIVE